MGALENFRAKNKKYENIKMTYAGRLDPLVSGLLLVLAGEATKEKEKYLKLSKEYKFKILFGFATDTFDILGKVILSRRILDMDKKELGKSIQKNLQFFRGEFMQSYPMYSSKPVAGKPLFAHARAGRVVKSPKHKVKVMSLKFLSIGAISRKKLLENIERRIAKVKGPARNAKNIAFAGGDFRQKEILKIWREKLAKGGGERFFTADFHIKCGSGTYVRAIANDLGKRMRTPSLALSIKRTKIGKWSRTP